MTFKVTSSTEINRFENLEDILIDGIINDLEDGNVFYDIGANVGVYSLLASKKLGTRGLVVSIEPEPINLDILHANVQKRNLKNVKIMKKAVWNSRTTMNLYRGSGWGDHSVIKPSKRYEEVQAGTLDNTVGELGIDKVDFVKMDIEGAELEALQGAEKVLSEAEKVAVAAYHERGEEETQFKVQEFLENRNFETRVSKDGVVHAWK